MSESKIIYAIIPPEEEKGLILTGKGFFSMRAISKNLPKYSTVICGDSQKEINMQMALEIEPSVYLKIFGDLEINEFRALNSIEILENKSVSKQSTYFRLSTKHAQSVFIFS